MIYRTRTYLAADWSGDSDAIEKIHDWNDSDRLSLSFSDAHDLTQSKDSSLKCNIKKSLRERLKGSKRFVLIVGNNTISLTNGSCRYCTSYNSWNASCARGHSIDYRSFIEYECAMALKDGLEIVVLYNSAMVNRSKCPDLLRNEGNHVAMCFRGADGKLYWDYSTVRDALA